MNKGSKKEKNTGKVNGDDISELERLALESDDVTAQLSLGYKFYHGEGVDRNMEKSVHFYDKAAEKGNSEALNNLAKIYLNYEGVVVDEEVVKNWHSKAESHGNKEAASMFSEILDERFISVEDAIKKISEGESILNIPWADERSLPRRVYDRICESSKKKVAATLLGACLVGGIGAGAAGYGPMSTPSLHYGMGGMHDNVLVVGDNNKRAADWYEKSAEQGNAYAQNNLGYMYYHGKGIEQDYEKTFYWFKKSAEQGHAYGQNNLGIMYENGKEVEQDYEKAIELYEKSAEQGLDTAKENLESLKEKL